MGRQAILLALWLFAASAAAQAPDELLAKLTPENQAWVNRSCPQSLGPSLWNNCVRREVSALARGIPDISRLGSEERNWLLRSCPSSLGPSLAISCLTRERIALTAGMPSIANLPPDKQARIRQACPQSLPPSLYKSCVNRESSASAGVARPPAPSSAPSPAIAGAPARVPTRRIRPGGRADTYEIEVSHNDELFVINGEKYEAQTYCFNMEEGDPVMFLEGNAFGACASAVILNLRTREKCSVWCE